MPDSVSDWIGIIAAIGMFLFGGGGVIAWRRLNADRKSGVQRETRADVDSLNARAVAIVESQFNFLVTPLQSEVQDLRDRVEKQDARYEKLNTRYWKSIGYIRKLYEYISHHVQADVIASNELPQPPTELVGDI